MSLLVLLLLTSCGGGEDGGKEGINATAVGRCEVRHFAVEFVDAKRVVERVSDEERYGVECCCYSRNKRVEVGLVCYCVKVMILSARVFWMIAIVIAVMMMMMLMMNRGSAPRAFNEELYTMSRGDDSKSTCYARR